jgi:stringent starvation protein B
MTELLKRRIADSLARVESALDKWREGELGEFEAHAEVLRHAARTEQLAARMARVGFDSAGALMRDAYDAGLIERSEFWELMGCSPDEVEPSPPIDESGATEPVALPDKRQVVDELLEGGAVLVHVDARAPQVRVPERFRGDAKLVLRFGYNLSPAVPDLVVDCDGIRGTLTFGGVPHLCVLPWHAVYAVVSDSNSRGLVWPDDVPDDVIGELAGAGNYAGEGDTGRQRPAGVPGDRHSSAHDDNPGRPSADVGKPSRKGGHLRLVK